MPSRRTSLQTLERQIVSEGLVAGGAAFAGTLSSEVDFSLRRTPVPQPV